MNRWRTGLHELGRSLFLLTTGERQALCLVLVLALLGLTVRTWQAWHRPLQGPATSASGKATP